MTAKELANKIYTEDIGVKRQCELIAQNAPAGQAQEYTEAVSAELYKLMFGEED
jgi:hypothetical protein